MKRISLLCIGLFISYLSFTQVIGNHIRFCTYSDFTSIKDECIAYEVRYDKREDRNFSNAPNGDFSAATPSFYIAIIYPYDPFANAKLAVRISNGNFEYARDASFSSIVHRSNNLSFIGWDKHAYDISYKKFIGLVPSMPRAPCPKIVVNNSECKGNACNVLGITPTQVANIGGFKFTNNGNCAIVMRIRYFFGSCSNPDNVTIPAHQSKSIGNTYCKPIEANYQ